MRHVQDSDLRSSNYSRAIAMGENQEVDVDSVIERLLEGVYRTLLRPFCYRRVSCLFFVFCGLF